MKVNGKMMKKKEKEFTIIIMNHGKVIDMKVNWKNDKKEGKGIYYYNNGDRQMGDYYNDNPIGKHVTLTKNG